MFADEPIWSCSVDSNEIIQSLALRPHPEGGWYRELHRSSLRVKTPHTSRCALTSIYYLLQHQERSRWHTVDADEIWHFYSGAPLELFTYEPTTRAFVRRVLAAPGAQSEPAAAVPAGTWQAARTLGDYSLVGCSVGPGFEFADFRFVSELADHTDHFSEVMQHLRELL
jgi:predicted cupin superfamily sugar epimerase